MPEEIKRELLAIAEAVEGLLQWESELAEGGFPEAAPQPAVDLSTARSASVGAENAVTSQPEGPTDTQGSSPAPPVASPIAMQLPETAALAPPAEHSEPAQPATGPRRHPSLQVLQDRAAACTACGLHHGRTKSVFARGDQRSELVFVGEGPGFHEDQQGVPFVGPAGQLLDKMIAAMGYARDEVYICNVVKCRPPDNRTPLPDEAKACEDFLVGQLANVNPKMIVSLGKCATEALGCMEPGQRRWRGVFSEYAGVPVMPTYHPAFLLRSPQFKRAVWDDLQLVMAKLGKTAG